MVASQKFMNNQYIQFIENSREYFSTSTFGWKHQASFFNGFGFARQSEIPLVFPPKLLFEFAEMSYLSNRVNHAFIYLTSYGNYKQVLKRNKL